VGIFEHDKPGRTDATIPMIAGHKGATLDFDFNPFHEHIIATASDDTSLKIWGIPEGGLTETITEPLVDLKGHGRKVLSRAARGLQSGAKQSKARARGTGRQRRHESTCLHAHWLLPQAAATTSLPLWHPVSSPRPPPYAPQVALCKFHPTTANVLSSISSDMTVKLWDIEKGSEISSCVLTSQFTTASNDTRIATTRLTHAGLKILRTCFFPLRVCGLNGVDRCGSCVRGSCVRGSCMACVRLATGTGAARSSSRTLLGTTWGGRTR